MKKYKVLVIMLTGAMLISSAGCSVTGKPKPRPGCYAANSIGVNFRNADAIGNHNFSSSIGESTGIVYTCRGGHIDLAHLRIGSDHVYYLYNFCRGKLSAGQKEWNFNLSYDPTQFHTVITYPAGFDVMAEAQRNKLMNEISNELAQYFAWYLTTWHEIITWYGHGTFLVPEFHSAFAWEDSYSNLLGVILGGRAVAATVGQGTGAYNDKMTRILEDELIRLGAVSKETARNASEQVRGKWYSGSVSVQMLLRNLDVGGADGCVSPAIVPNVCMDVKAECLAVPKLEKFTAAGFKLRLEASPPGHIKSKVRNFIYRGNGTGPILADEHLPVVMKQIASEARGKGYSVIE